MSTQNKIMRFISESISATGRYFYTKLLTSLIIAFSSYFIFEMLEIKLSGVLSTILGITNLIPVFGPWVGVILCAVIVVFQQPVFALYTSIIAILLQLLEQFLLMPMIAGKSLDLKPLAIILSLFLGSLLFGFWGVIFAVPVAAAVKIGYKIFVKEDKTS